MAKEIVNLVDLLLLTERYLENTVGKKGSAEVKTQLKELGYELAPDRNALHAEALSLLAAQETAFLCQPLENLPLDKRYLERLHQQGMQLVGDLRRCKSMGFVPAPENEALAWVRVKILYPDLFAD